MATFSDLITHTRASTATYVDSSGNLQTAASGVPRVGHHIYDGSQWVNEGILHESEARTNVLLDSGDPTTANWGTKQTTATQNATDLFGNANSAWTLEDDDASNFERNEQEITVPDDSNTHTCQLFIAKDNDETRFPEFQLRMTGGATEVKHFLQINTKTGAITARLNEGSDTSFVEDWGDFWRVVMSATNNGTGNTNLTFRLFPAGGLTLGDTIEASATGSIVYAGGQVELNTSTPSSYIPTAGSQVTRAGDSMTIPAAKLPYDATNMSIAMEGRVTYAQASSLESTIRFYEWLLNGDNYIRDIVQTADTRTGQFVFAQRYQGTTDIEASGSNLYSPGINVPFSIASRHGSTFINGAIDGTALTANTTPTALPDLSATNLQLGQAFMGTIRLFRMWDDDLGDTGIAEASA